MISPTPYPEVNTLLEEMLARVQAVLGDTFVGFYLGGSLASGDFDPRTSDLDFVVVTAADLPAAVIAALEKMHAHLLARGSPWAAKLEGSYIPQKAFRRYNPADGPFPCLNEGAFYLAPHETHWIIQRLILRAQGIVIAGPSPETLIDPVTPADLRQAVVGFLQDWWLPMLADPARLTRPDYQAYAVLTLCRALYTLEFGITVSKPAAARWALGALEERWSALITWALAWQPGSPSGDLDEIRAFIRFTLSRSAIG